VSFFPLVSRTQIAENTNKNIKKIKKKNEMKKKRKEKQIIYTVRNANITNSQLSPITELRTGYN
jgi:hypothetical protein